MKITQIVIHHAGGIGNDNNASTRHLTPQHISNAHKQRWGGYNPSQYILDENLRYGGYTVYYEPITRKFTQMRAIGEETIAVKGQNFNTFQLCIGGNYNKGVDPLTMQIEKDITLFLHDLINGNKRNLIVANNTEKDFAISRIYSHRHFKKTTNCYGTGIANNHFRDLVIKYKPVIISGEKPDLENIQKQISILAKLVATLQEIIKNLFK